MPDRRAFVARLWSALDAYPLSVGAKELVVAHAAFESGWGAAKASRLGLNHWNLTRIPSDPRPVIKGGDLEYSPAGRVRHIVQRFRAYHSDDEAIADYFAFLDRPRYHAALEQLKAGNAPEFVRALREDDPATPQPEGGFFTASLAHYQSGIAASLAAVRRIRAGAEA